MLSPQILILISLKLECCSYLKPGNQSPQTHSNLMTFSLILMTIPQLITGLDLQSFRHSKTSPGINNFSKLRISHALHYTLLVGCLMNIF